MGCKPIPRYADMFMADIDIRILEIIESDKDGFMKLFKRFLDDIISVWCGSLKALHKIFEAMNQLHPNIKFTMNHTTPNNKGEENNCGCDYKTTVPFLDTSLCIENGQIVTDLYKKPTDKNLYLLPNSCHPLSTTKSIPYSLALRITRICSNPKTTDKRYDELNGCF